MEAPHTAMHTFVLVPGLGSDSAVWDRTIQELKGTVECLVGDTRSDDSLAGMAQRILNQAPERFMLAGVSMGGIVAMEMMRQAPERILCLALVDTIARPDGFFGRLYRHLSNLLVTYGNFRSLSTFSLRSMVHATTPQEVRDEIVEMSLRVGAEVYRRQNRAVSRRVDYRPLLSRVAVPTAVIVGADDRMTPMKFSKEIHERIQGSTLQVITACGHLPPIEQPRIVAASLLALMRREPQVL